LRAWRVNIFGVCFLRRKMKKVFLDFSEFEAMLVLIKLGYSQDRLSNPDQKMIERKLDEACNNLVGCGWYEHVEYILKVNNGIKTGIRI
jgi:hypothetical protein